MTGHAAIFAEWFAVPPAAGRIAAAFHAAGEAGLTLEGMMTAGGQTRNGAHLSLKLLRAAMDQPGIVFVGPNRWRLSREGRADLENALADAKRRDAA